MDMGKTDKHPLAYKIVDHQMERGTLTPHDLISKFGVEAPKAHQIAGYISNDPYEKRVNKISNILNSNTSKFSYDMGRNKDRTVVNKSTEDGASEHIPTHLNQLQTKADAYHKAGDIKSANALRDKIKIIKTKHGMAPASTQKAEGKKPFDRLNTQYTKPKFNMGDKVRSIHNPNMIGEVSHNMAAPIEGVKKYKVTEPNGKRSHWDEDGMVKISDEEHAKGTSYYKPTQKTEVEDLSRSETRLAILAKGLKAAITLRGLVKAEKEIKSSGGGNK